MKTTVDTSFATPTEEEGRSPASKQSPFKKRTATQSHPGASTSAAKRIKGPGGSMRKCSLKEGVRWYNASKLE
jgi:hypothetical protein